MSRIHPVLLKCGGNANREDEAERKKVSRFDRSQLGVPSDQFGLRSCVALFARAWSTML